MIPKRWGHMLKHPTQHRLVVDSVRIKIGTAGRRSGKTERAKRFVSLMSMVEQKDHNFTRRYLIGAPTNPQAMKIYWQDMIDLTKHWQHTKPNKSSQTIFIQGARDCAPSEIVIAGLDQPARTEGVPYDGLLIDEIGNCKQDAWTHNLRPTMADRGAWAWLIGVPEGKNFYYDLALQAAGGSIPKTIPGQGVTAYNPDLQMGYYSWHSADILPEKEIKNARATMDEKTYRQEFEGSFETFRGLAYYAFGNRNIDNTICYNAGQAVHIGMDFNVNPMTATFSHVKENKIYQFGEAYLENSNTAEMIEHIKGLFPTKSCIIYPDATGGAEKSNASESDIKQIRRAGFRIKSKKSNPLQKNRMADVNSVMRSDDGAIRYFVNAEKCPKMIRDWQKVERTDDGRINKKQEGQGLVHLSDAFGYFVYNYFGRSPGLPGAAGDKRKHA